MFVSFLLLARARSGLQLPYNWGLRGNVASPLRPVLFENCFLKFVDSLSSGSHGEYNHRHRRGVTAVTLWTREKIKWAVMLWNAALSVGYLDSKGKKGLRSALSYLPIEMSSAPDEKRIIVINFARGGDRLREIAFRSVTTIHGWLDETSLCAVCGAEFAVKRWQWKVETFHFSTISLTPSSSCSILSLLGKKIDFSVIFVCNSFYFW